MKNVEVSDFEKLKIKKKNQDHPSLFSKKGKKLIYFRDFLEKTISEVQKWKKFGERNINLRTFLQKRGEPIVKNVSENNSFKLYRLISENF